MQQRKRTWPHFFLSQPCLVERLLRAKRDRQVGRGTCIPCPSVRLPRAEVAKGMESSTELTGCTQRSTLLYMSSSPVEHREGHLRVSKRLLRLIVATTIFSFGTEGW